MQAASQIIPEGAQDVLPFRCVGSVTKDLEALLLALFQHVMDLVRVIETSVQAQDLFPLLSPSLEDSARAIAGIYRGGMLSPGLLLDQLVQLFPEQGAWIEDVRLVACGPLGGSAWLREGSLDWSGHDRRPLALRAILSCEFKYGVNYVDACLTSLEAYPGYTLRPSNALAYWQAAMNLAAERGRLRDLVLNAAHGFGQPPRSFLRAFLQLPS